MRFAPLALAVTLALPVASFAVTPAPSAAIAAAVNDPARQADTAKDAQRKVAEIMAFAEVKPGQSVLELIPGGGYFTRVFSALVGPQGHVYAVWPNEYNKVEPGDADKMKTLASQAHYANIAVALQPANQLNAPTPVDLVFTSQNYHDYPDKFMGKVDPSVLDKQVFDALKPGGLFVVIDHAGEKGSGLRDTDTLHRIDPSIVKKEVEAAGFVFESESDVLRNSADTHTLKVFDPAIRGKTDQFIYKFRKPK